jgi:hypothetical protein
MPCCSYVIICTGGYRLWPKPGYWSESEESLPVKCRPEEACQGGRSRSCTEGYTGDYCSECDEGYYKDSFGYCISCSADDSDRAVGQLLIACALMFVLVISVCIVVLPDKWLDLTVATFVGFQQFVKILTMASDQIPNQYQSIISSLSLIFFFTFLFFISWHNCHC